MPLNTLIAGARRHGPALAEGWLPSLPPYCGLVSGNGRVTGELFEVDEQLLDKLDRVEGFDPGDPRGSLYLRKGVSVQRFSDGGLLDAETYIYNQKAGVGGRLRIQHLIQQAL